MRMVLVIFGLAIVIGGGIFGFLVYIGKINLGSASAPKPVAQVVPPNATLVPWNTRQLPADTLITRELLVNPTTGEIFTHPVFLSELQGKGVMTHVGQVLGRVLRKDLRPGYVFTETDFYPIGTRPGITAEIPPGKRSVTLDASKISGARLLKRGDHVDLLATQAYDLSRKALAGNPRLGIAQGDPSLLVKKATVRVLAQDGMVIIPVTIRQVPAAPGTKTHIKPIEEISIAVDSAEVAGVMEAIGADAEMFCIVHSGRPADPKTIDRLPPPPDPQIATQVAPIAPVTRIETFIGRKHEFLSVPSVAVQLPQTQPASALAPDPGGSAHQ